MSEINKEIVRRFNREVIEKGDRAVFESLFDDEFINHSAPPGMPNGAEGMWHTFENILRPAFSGLKVTIHDQIAEGDKVTTRKSISGKHTGPLMGIAPTDQTVSIDVIDIVAIHNGKYIAHWGVNTLPSVLLALQKQA